MPTAAIITHVAFEDAGSFTMELLRRGFTLAEYDASTVDWSTTALQYADLLIVLGGPIGAYEAHRYPFLGDELRFLRERLQRRAPTLGICLGAQLMAAALGANVYPGRNGKELGWAPLRSGRDQASCPAIDELLQPGLRVLHWHGDTFELPTGASHLAATDAYENQAWSLGQQILALQFHPEVTVRGLERWYVGHAVELSVTGTDVDTLRRDSARHGPVLQTAAGHFWRRWLDGVCGA